VVNQIFFSVEIAYPNTVLTRALRHYGRRRL